MNNFNDDESNIAGKNNNNIEQTDKTRIATKSPSSDEKTRIAPANKTPPVDKTRIAPSVRAGTPIDDKTRIAINKKTIKQSPIEQKSLDQNATQFKPPKLRSNSTEQRKTDNNSSQNSEKPTIAATAQQAQSQGSDLQILKGRFILEKVLGAGGMGVVYKAKDLVKVEAGDKDPYLAIKVLGDEFKQHPEAFMALQRESRKTQRIAHPNIVNVHDFDRDGDTVFMTMEYLEGKPLDELIRQYRSTGLPTDEAQNILKNICRALIYAHKQHIIHSDFKPGNIFITNKGETKVFDFGIARAVAKAEHYEENLEDKTIFDAGDLGALTPAYASAEMLDGKEPDIRDDIYALGCVAYELFTGSHPFNKVPADEAKKQKLKPKRINHISRRQWKAIEKSLAFDREDRVETIKDFLVLFTKTNASYKLPLLLVSALLIFGVVYASFFWEAPKGVSETEIRSELEFTLRLENYRNNISEYILSLRFNERWEKDLWQDFENFKKLLSTSDKWLKSTANPEFKTMLQTNNEWFIKTEAFIYNAYIEKIRAVRLTKDYPLAERLILNAYRYSATPDLVDQEKQLLQQDKARDKLLAEKVLEEKRLLEAARIENKAKDIVVKNEDKVVKVDPKKLQNDQFQLALSNVQTQLNCQTNKLNMRNFETALEKLRSIDHNRYLKQEGQIINALVNCIEHIGKAFPERAIEYKKLGLELFDNNRSIMAIIITPKDPCSTSLAGLGARGKRAICKDSLVNSETGPELVVIPAGNGLQAFALGKYEISISEYNLFCKLSRSCSEIKTTNESLPLANISITQAQNYLDWLSEKSKRKYRLPSKTEWLYAANGVKSDLDPNRNCRVNTRGISRGDKFDKVTIGQQNSWGLVNTVGNASEWVYDNGKKLNAVGGSYNILLEECNLSTLLNHTGKADEYTGFRVLREIE